MSDVPATHKRGWLSILGWGAYLACSWTWCIGMFLPVLLIRDFGPWSFVVFALPNVIGATVMGLVLAREGASEAIVTNHAIACRVFSFVTMTFQWFFLLWVMSGLVATRADIAIALGGAATLLLLVAWADRSDVRIRAVSLLVLAVSAACMVWWFLRGDASVTPSLLTDARPIGLLWLAPVCCFGFILCPYLDLTFHRARRALPGPAGNAAFAIGFCGLFFLMILFTSLYAGTVLSRAEARGLVTDPRLAGVAVILHIAVQLFFTISIHTTQIARLRAPTSPPVRGSMLLSLLIALLILPIARWVHAPHGMSGHEVVYRGFMGFYGLVFPAYVWLCVIPLRDGTAPTRRRVTIFTFAVLIALSMYFMGFVMQEYWWLAPGVAIPLCARLLVRRTPAHAESV